MKKSLKTRIKKWKIGDYVRQFSIVAGGVLLTLWLTDYIAEVSKQREVRQAMQLVTLELQDNLRTIQNYKDIFETEKRIAIRLQVDGFSTADLPSDTIVLYRQKLYGGLVRPYRFSTDALEMLKTSGLTSHIGDKRLVIALLRCYKSIESFDKTMDFYFNMRKEAITGYQNKYLKKTTPTQRQEFIDIFRQMTADPAIQNWLCSMPRSFDDQFFANYKAEAEGMITQLTETYN